MSFDLVAGAIVAAVVLVYLLAMLARPERYLGSARHDHGWLEHDTPLRRPVRRAGKACGRLDACA